MINLLWLAAFLFHLGVILVLPALYHAAETEESSDADGTLWQNESPERLDVVCVWGPKVEG